MFDSTSSGIFVYTLDGKLVDLNRAACELHGWSREQMLTMSPADFIAPESMDVFHAFREAMARGEEYRGVARGVRADGGTTFDVEVYGVPIELNGETFAFSSLTDISETVRLREKLHEAERLDALGRLAGGVAHDFNNMLTIIMASVEFAQIAKTKPGAVDEAFVEILAAAERARALTTQLMSFSQHRTLIRGRVDVEELLRATVALVSRALPDDIEFVTALDTGPLFVDGDAGPLEQVVVNLVLNARDALRDQTGRILLRSRTRVIDEEAIPELDAGYYVEITVHDDGRGMDSETRSHIFEPFFTTKGAGGTGLGLASAYGTIRQHGGCILVYSEPGRGTTFRIYLPVSEDALPSRRPVSESSSASLAGVSAVVVDDDPTVRELIVRALERLGATAIPTTTDDASTVLSRANADLLVADVFMPGEDGMQLFTRLRAEAADLRILYVSGYGADHLARGGLVDSSVEVLSKPFTTAELAAAVQRVMDSEP